MKTLQFASVLSLSMAVFAGAAQAQTMVVQPQPVMVPQAQVTVNAQLQGGPVMAPQPGMMMGGGMGMAGGVGMRGGMGMGRGEVRDDWRDLQRFEGMLQQFDFAVQRQDINSVHSTLSMFVQMGRSEVMELQREVQRAGMEAQRSAQAAQMGGNVVYNNMGQPVMVQNGSNWQARRDARDFQAEQMRLNQAIQILNQLEQAANANFQFGPQVPILMQARSAMVQFVSLAQQELQASIREQRQDMRAGGGFPVQQPVYVQQPTQPVYVQQPAQPVYVQQPTQPLYVQQPVVVAQPPIARPPVVVGPAPVVVVPGRGWGGRRGRWH